jgi:CRP/FNR family transcriptional regulator
VTVSGQALARFPFFAALSDDARQKIAPHFHERSFSSGQTIALEGEHCREVYFVARGVARVYRLSPEGREQVLAHLGPGEMFNLVPALDSEPSRASVDALTEVTLYIIPCQRFRQIMRENQEAALAVARSLAAEVRRLSDMVEDLALHTVRARLARFLLAQAEDPQRTSHRWTQAEIAAYIGTVREMVGRTLRAFDTAGLIRRQRGRIVVMDREGLEKAASDAY